MGNHPIVSLTADKVGRKTNAVVDGEQMPIDFKQRCAVDNLLSFPFFSLSVSLPINYTPGTWARVRAILPDIGLLKHWVVMRRLLPTHEAFTYGGVVQLVEHSPHKGEVGGSIPPAATNMGYWCSTVSI